MNIVPTTTDSASGLEVARVSYSFGETQALCEVSMSLGLGINGVLGVNGAGKTTLLRILAGQLRPVSGECRYGTDSSLGLSYRRRVSILPQHFTFPGNYRVREFVAFAAWLKGNSSRRAGELADDSLSAVGLIDRRDARMRSLSGGMRRRAGLASALVGDPEILVLDEPTTGVDPEQRATLRELIRVQSKDRIIVFSSHVLEDVQQLADHVVVLHEGRVVADQPLDDLIAKPGGREGATNLLEEAFLRLIRNSDR